MLLSVQPYTPGSVLTSPSPLQSLQGGKTAASDHSPPSSRASLPTSCPCVPRSSRAGDRILFPNAASASPRDTSSSPPHMKNNPAPCDRVFASTACPRANDGHLKVSTDRRRPGTKRARNTRPARQNKTHNGHN